MLLSLRMNQGEQPKSKVVKLWVLHDACRQPIAGCKGSETYVATFFKLPEEVQSYKEILGYFSCIIDIAAILLRKLVCCFISRHYTWVLTLDHSYSDSD